MEQLLWLLAGHFIGDFAFQSDWMATRKGSSWEINAYHAATYSAVMMLVSGIGGFPLPPVIVALFFISHFLIDPLKARWNVVKHIWVDQFLHFLVILYAIWNLG